jgi:hypothetical protein
MAAIVRHGVSVGDAARETRRTADAARQCEMTSCHRHELA